MRLTEELKRRLAAKGTEEIDGRNVWLDNDDIRPLAVKDRTWSQKAYFTSGSRPSLPVSTAIFPTAALCITDGYTVATWYGGSAAQSFGLNLWEVLGSQVAGWFLIASIFMLNERAGAVYHVGFPIDCRAAFGVFGGWWPTFNRAVGKCNLCVANRTSLRCLAARFCYSYVVHERLSTILIYALT